MTINHKVLGMVKYHLWGGTISKDSWEVLGIAKYQLLGGTISKDSWDINPKVLGMANY